MKMSWIWVVTAAWQAAIMTALVALVSGPLSAAAAAEEAVAAERGHHHRPTPPPPNLHSHSPPPHLIPPPRFHLAARDEAAAAVERSLLTPPLHLSPHSHLDLTNHNSPASLSHSSSSASATSQPKSKRSSSTSSRNIYSPHLRDTNNNFISHPNDDELVNIDDDHHHDDNHVKNSGADGTHTHFPSSHDVPNSHSVDSIPLGDNEQRDLMALREELQRRRETREEDALLRWRRESDLDRRARSGHEDDRSPPYNYGSPGDPSYGPVHSTYNHAHEATLRQSNTIQSAGKMVAYIDDCCPTEVQIVQPRGGVSKDGRILELYREGNATQSFYQASCAEGVGGGGCRFIAQGIKSRCVQQFSYTYALVREFYAPKDVPWRLDYIRIRTGCQCSVLLKVRESDLTD